MSPSSNQRRAIPVVTMMTFHVGVSGVASRSRLTTPTFSSVGAEDLLGDRADGERLAGARAGDDAEALAAARQLAHARAVLPLEKRLDVEPHRELDRLAGGARRRDDDDASRRRLGRDERVVIGDVLVADRSDRARRRRRGDRLLRWTSGKNRRRLHAREALGSGRQLGLVALLGLGRVGVVVAEQAPARSTADS